MAFLKFLILILSANIIVAPAPCPIVSTDHGQILGVTLKSDTNSYHAFRAIPYAEPPVGGLRFDPPVELQSNWTAVLNATTEVPPKCLQWSIMDTSNPIQGTEDCLYLNVFTPKLPQQNTTQLLPVMVFIHGGGFMSGSADFYGERKIMETGKMLLVTLNYRLGVLGFLSTEDDVIAGNMGLKDQAMALKWVHSNIEQFGGDKRKVLLAGWSSGGASVHYHLVSEVRDSNKWFSSAASFSGTALCSCHTIYAGEAHRKAQLMAEYVNCTREQLTTNQGIKDCLQRKDADDIIQQVPKFYKYLNHPFAIFGPVIDCSLDATKFLTSDVESLMRRGSDNPKLDIPWLVTRTAEDGASIAAEFLRKDQHGKELINALNDRWSEVAEYLLFLNPALTREAKTALAQQYKAEYFGSKNISLETYEELQRLFNEEMSNKHMNRAVKLFSESSPHARVYGLVYDNPPPFGSGQIITQREDIKFGTFHGDDIFLIFDTVIRKNHPLREDENRIAYNLVDMLITFANNGVPLYAGKTLSRLSASNNFEFDILTKEGLKESAHS